MIYLSIIALLNLVGIICLGMALSGLKKLIEQKATVPIPLAQYPKLFNEKGRLINSPRNFMYIDAVLMFQANGINNTNALRVEFWKAQMPITSKDLHLLMEHMNREGLIVYQVS